MAKYGPLTQMFSRLQGPVRGSPMVQGAPLVFNEDKLFTPISISIHKLFFNPSSCPFVCLVKRWVNNFQYFQYFKSTSFCRHDWHQTGTFAVLSVYCKNSDPEKTVIETNQVHLSISITFDGGKSQFQKEISLEGVGHKFRKFLMYIFLF